MLLLKEARNLPVFWFVIASFGFEIMVVPSFGMQAWLIWSKFTNIAVEPIASWFIVD